MKSLSW